VARSIGYVVRREDHDLFDHSLQINPSKNHKPYTKMSEEKKKKGKFWEFVREKVKPVIGDVVSIVGDVTGIEAIEKVGDLLNKKRDEDAQIAALAEEFEMKKLEYQMELQRMEFEYFKTEIADKQSARSREVEYIKATGGKRDWLLGATVIIALVMYVGAFAFLAFGPIVPNEKKDLFNMGVGQVFTFAGMAFAYYLGTTRSSRMKDETLSKVVK
jgi:hypothetical protein